MINTSKDVLLAISLKISIFSLERILEMKKNIDIN